MLSNTFTDYDTNKILTIEKLRFGYPNIDIYNYYKDNFSENELDYLKVKLRKIKRHNIRYSDLKKELTYIVNERKKFTKVDSVNIPKFFSSYLFDFKSMYDISSDKYDKLIKSILLTSIDLQGYFLRPSPSQICYIMGEKIYPENSEWCNLPTYPNFFILASKVLNSITAINQKKIDSSAKLFIGSGICYPTDITISYSIAEMICKDNYFINNISKKYK